MSLRSNKNKKLLYPKKGFKSSKSVIVLVTILLWIAGKFDAFLEWFQIVLDKLWSWGW